MSTPFFSSALDLNSIFAIQFFNRKKYTELQSNIFDYIVTKKIEICVVGTVKVMQDAECRNAHVQDAECNNEHVSVHAN